MKINEREAVILQKLIRSEKSSAYQLPHLDEDYVKTLDDLYLKVGEGIDYWEGYV